MACPKENCSVFLLECTRRNARSTVTPILHRLGIWRMLEARNDVGTRVASRKTGPVQGENNAQRQDEFTSTQVGVPMSLRRLNAKAADMISAIAVTG